MKVLAVSAHPDDADIWCGGTLKKFSENGHEIYICVVANGNLGTNKYTQKEIIAIREQEQLEAAKTYNAKTKFLKYNDFEIVDSVESRLKILDAIRWADPDVILTHYPKDPVTDHGMTGELVTRALLYVNFKNVETPNQITDKKPSIFFFDAYAGINFQPEVYVDITEQYKFKREAFERHKSQMEYNNTGDGWLKVMESLSAFRGLQAGYIFAEGFIGYKMYGYMPDYKLLP